MNMTQRLARGLTTVALLTLCGSTSQAARSAEAIQKVIRSHQAHLDDCYKRQLKRHPKLEGRLVLRFTIDGAGRVRDARAEVTPDDRGLQAVGRCFLKQARTWRFGADAAKDTKVSYPFVVSRADGDGR